jgi:endonuclease-3 related protein
MKSRLISPAAVQQVYLLLYSCYGLQGWWPILSRAGESGFDGDGYHPGCYELPVRAAERFEIAAGAILTQNTSWSNVRRALRALLEAGMLNPAAVAAAQEERLARLIRPSGYYNQKAKKLRLFAGYFIERAEDHGGGENSIGENGSNAESGETRVLPPGRDELLALWGIGPETADSILLYAYGVPLFVVDAYTRRLAARLSGVPQQTGDLRYEALQELFGAGLPGEDEEQRRRNANEYHALIVAHAKERCTARDPQCRGCPLERECLYPQRYGL